MRRARTMAGRRDGYRRVRAGLPLRDRMLVALTDRAALLNVVESTHRIGSWASWARESSISDLREGVDLIEAERGRLEERLRHLAARREALTDDLVRASHDAESDRILRRLQELVEQRTQLETLLARMKAEVEVESIEWQRPLVAQDGSVVGFVDLWATLRVTYFRIVRGADGADHEKRQRYEGYSAQHITRSYMLQVVPAVRSLTELVRRVRFAQAHAKEAAPIVVTCAPLAPEVLASQGIPTYVWSPDGGAVSTARALPAPNRRARRSDGERAGAAEAPTQPGLPSPRPSLPPARSSGSP